MSSVSNAEDTDAPGACGHALGGSRAAPSAGRTHADVALGDGSGDDAAERSILIEYDEVKDMGMSAMSCRFLQSVLCEGMCGQCCTGRRSTSSTDPEQSNSVGLTTTEGLRRAGKFGFRASKILMTHQITLNRLKYKPEPEREEKTARLNRLTAKEALDLIISLRGYYIKAAQTLTGAGQLPPELEESFSVLLDQCPREPFEVVKKIIEEELGCPMAAVFQDFDRDAVAAASIGQVHFATLKNGMRVAVKVQYPHVEKFFKVDLKMVSTAMQLAGLGAKVRETFAVMEKQFEQEFDYTKEAKVMSRFAANLMPHFGRQVVIPRPFDRHHPAMEELPVPTLCTRKVLTMERIEGEPIREYAKRLLELVAEVAGVDAQELSQLAKTKDMSKVDANSKAVKMAMNMGEVSEWQSSLLIAGVRLRNCAAGLLGYFVGNCCSYDAQSSARIKQFTKRVAEPLNGRKLANLIYDVHGHQIFQNGLFNSDPHAGNVLMTPDGLLGLIDYGATMELTEEQRTHIAKMFVAIADEDDDAVAPALWACGFRSRNQDPRLALLFAHISFNRGPYPYDMNRLAPKTGMPLNPDLMTLDQYIRGGKLDEIMEVPGHLVMLQRCAMVLSGIAMELGAGRLSSAGMLKGQAQKWLAQRSRAAAGAP